TVVTAIVAELALSASAGYTDFLFDRTWQSQLVEVEHVGWQGTFIKKSEDFLVFFRIPAQLLNEILMSEPAEKMLLAFPDDGFKWTVYKSGVHEYFRKPQNLLLNQRVLKFYRRGGDGYWC